MRFLVFLCLVGACLAANVPKQSAKKQSSMSAPPDNSAAANTYKTGFASYPDLPNHSHQFPTTNQGCFPIVPETVSADPMTRLGRYYEYRMAYKDGQAYNLQYTTKMVNSDYVPGTDQPMVHTVQDDFRWITLGGGNGSSSSYKGNSNNQVTCTYNWNDIQSRYDGIDVYQLFDSENGPVNPVLQVDYLLYIAPGDRGWEIQYQCDKPNESTKLCEQANIYVNSRVPTNKLSQDEQQKMDDTINSVLKPYCMTTADLQKVMYRDNLSIDQCNQAAPEAYRNLIIGMDVGLRDRPADASTY